MSTGFDYENLEQRKNNFYRDQFRRMVSLLLVLIFVGVGLLMDLLVDI